MIFFDDRQVNQLDPLTCVRPAALLPCGILTIAEKWERRLNRHIITHFPRVLLRKRYADMVPGESQLWINGRWVPDPTAASRVQALLPHQALFRGDLLLAVVTDNASFQRWSDTQQTPEHWESDQCSEGWLVERSWELLDHTSTEIERDLSVMTGLDPLMDPPPGVWVTDPHRVRVGQNVHIEPGVVLVPGDGFIVLDDGAQIQAGACLRGSGNSSIYIGKGSTVRMGAQIYGGVRMGRSCKVAGELQDSILMDYVNKTHGGFLGHSILAEWVNLGADTNTSNLKNNYTSIKVDDWHTGALIDTGRQFLGSILADHTKIAIGSKLNSGTQSGLFSSFIHRDFSPKRIPHFAWFTDSALEAQTSTVSDFVVYDFDKAMAAAKIAMARRGQSLEDPMMEVFRHFHPFLSP